MAQSVKYKLFNSKLTAVVSVSLVLVLLGITTMFLLTSKNLSDHVRENFIFKLTLKDGMDEKAVGEMDAFLHQKTYIKDVKYVSKEQAVKDLTEMLGDDPMEFLDENPLPNSFEVSLRAPQITSDSLKIIENDLMRNKMIVDVDYPHDIVDSFARNVRNVSMAFLIVAGVLLFISFALINNTIRLLIYSDRLLIHTMKQVGATRSFIRRPYMKQGLVIGVLSSLLAITVLALIFFCMGDLSEDLELYLDLHNTRLYLTTYAVILVAGILITELSTYLAVNKYLRQKVSTLYLI